MPPIGRPQLLLYAALALAVLVLGARALLADRAAAPPAAVVETGGAAPGARAGEGEPVGEGGSGAQGGEPPANDGSQPALGESGTGNASPAGARPTQAELAVHVAGAVTTPGVYRVVDGARVQDAIELAGGPRRGADLHALNLAAKVSDGQQILVPRRSRRQAAAAAGAPTTTGGATPGGAPDAGAAKGAPGAGAGAAGAVIDLNSASLAELETLDGVGPAIAQKIVAWREANGGFRTVDDLAQVSGIGPKKLEAIRPRVAV